MNKMNKNVHRVPQLGAVVVRLRAQLGVLGLALVAFLADQGVIEDHLARCLSP